MRIVFMGTPDFAVASLEAIRHAGHTIAAVVTAPDTFGGRGGKQLIQSAVKQYAVEQKLHVLQPIKLKDKNFIKELRSLNAELHVVVAFRMLPEIVWNMPPWGTINVHGSLLPKYRGAAPIHWAVIQGEKITGITVFKLRHVIDTGDIIKQESIEIGPNETTGDLSQRMKILGAETLMKSISLLSKGDLHLTHQDDLMSCPAPKLFHESGRIDFNQTSFVIHNLIRGMSPKPTAWMILHGTKYFFYRSVLTEITSTELAGSLYIDDHQLILATIDFNIFVREIQLEGKRIQSDKEFINGHWKNPIYAPVKLKGDVK
ncbi:MAG: methionyl-tRNA formyltransferase [Saprospiraceae bacterium]